jgi:hypothetical protein
MSKVSSKQRYNQLVSWLETLKKKPTSKEKQSRLDYYKTKGA